MESVNEAVVVEIIAESLDSSNVEEFKHAMSAALVEHLHVVMDMGRLRFVDSSGCAALLTCLRRFHERGGDLVLCELQPPVRVVLELVRMHKVLGIHGNRAEALQAVQAGLGA